MVPPHSTHEDVQFSLRTVSGRRCPFPSLYSCPFAVIELPYTHGFVPEPLYSIPLIHLYLLLLVPDYLACFTFAVKSEIRVHGVSSFVLPTKDCSDYPESSVVLTNLKIGCSLL